jgi:hypothetical protein
MARGASPPMAKFTGAGRSRRARSGACKVPLDSLSPQRVGVQQSAVPFHRLIISCAARSFRCILSCSSFLPRPSLFERGEVPSLSSLVLTGDRSVFSSSLLEPYHPSLYHPSFLSPQCLLTRLSLATSPLTPSSSTRVPPWPAPPSPTATQSTTPRSRTSPTRPSQRPTGTSTSTGST